MRAALKVGGRLDDLEVAFIESLVDLLDVRVTLDGNLNGDVPKLPQTIFILLVIRLSNNSLVDLILEVVTREQ